MLVVHNMLLWEAFTPWNDWSSPTFSCLLIVLIECCSQPFSVLPAAPGKSSLKQARAILSCNSSGWWDTTVLSNRKLLLTVMEAEGWIPQRTLGPSSHVFTRQKISRKGKGRERGRDCPLFFLRTLIPWLVALLSRLQLNLFLPKPPSPNIVMVEVKT